MGGAARQGHLIGTAPVPVVVCLGGGQSVGPYWQGQLQGGEAIIYAKCYAHLYPQGLLSPVEDGEWPLSGTMAVAAFWDGQTRIHQPEGLVRLFPRPTCDAIYLVTLTLPGGTIGPVAQCSILSPSAERPHGLPCVRC